jgi:hypothetical protein
MQSADVDPDVGYSDTDFVAFVREEIIRRVYQTAHGTEERGGTLVLVHDGFPSWPRASLVEPYTG